MNTKHKRKCIFVLTLILAQLWIFGAFIKADEIYYDPNTGQPIYLKWHVYKNGKPHLSINGDGLSQSYKPYYPNARNAWNNIGNKITTSESAKSSANVVLSTLSADSWDRIMGAKARTTSGITYLSDIYGTSIVDASSAKASTGLISYASLFFSPYNDTFFDEYNATRRTAVMVHEIGHALGLGHPRSYVKSIMNAPISPTFYKPQQFDINAIRNKY